MRIVYRSLNKEERESTLGQNLLKNIQTLDTKIKELDALSVIISVMSATMLELERIVVLDPAGRTGNTIHSLMVSRQASCYIK